ncbi:MAG: biopolymer transporter ExbD [Lentisphaerae bacterium]|nr:biopolymer transporter ExbD [Lentisphaerota bacterium]
MRIKRSTEGDSDIINLTPLIDMMFIMVIFFSLSSSFREEERDIKVNLPESAEGRTISAAAKLIVINVRRDGSFVVANRTVTVDELREMIFEAVRAAPDQKVLIRGDREALHGHVAVAVALCKRAGVHEANIGYQLPR